jgi:hypothetical protein
MDLGSLNQGAAGNGKFSVIIAGNGVEVNETDNVKDTLKRLLTNAGITSFTIFLDGDEIQSSEDLPDTFEDCTTLEVQKYTKSGGGCGK